MAFNKYHGIIGINVFFIVFMIKEIVTKWKDIPDVIPSHYNSKGEADRQSDKKILYVIPTVAVMLFVLLYISGLHPPQWMIPSRVTPQNQKELHGTARMYLMSISVFICSYLRTVCSVMIKSKPVPISPLISCVVTILMVTFLYVSTAARVPPEGTQAQGENRQQRKLREKEQKKQDSKAEQQKQSPQTSGKRKNKKKRN